MLSIPQALLLRDLTIFTTSATETSVKLKVGVLGVSKILLVSLLTFCSSILALLFAVKALFNSFGSKLQELEFENLDSTTSWQILFYH